MCKHRYWSTVESNDVLSEMELFEACHVHLIYLGNGVFGELKHRPFESAAPRPSVAENDEIELPKIHGKGRQRAKPLDLSKTVMSVETPSEEFTTKGEKDSTTNVVKIVPSTCTETGSTGAVSGADKDPEPEPELAPEPPMNTSNNQTAVVEDVLEPNGDAEPIHTETPLIVIPPEYWLIQPHEIADDDATKGRNDNSVIGANVKGRNDTGILNDESEGSKETIMSRVEDKVANMFIIEAEENKCVVPLERLSDQMIKTFQPSRKTSRNRPILKPG